MNTECILLCRYLKHFSRSGSHSPGSITLNLTARWYGELPSVSGLACVFAKSW